MIIQNGHIEFITVSGGGLDAKTGHPVAATKTYGKPIPCQFVPVTSDLLRNRNGEPVTKFSWTIYVEALSEYEIQSERLRLTDLKHNEVGEYSIIRAVPLTAVCEVAITV